MLNTEQHISSSWVSVSECTSAPVTSSCLIPNIRLWMSSCLSQRTMNNNRSYCINDGQRLSDCIRLQSFWLHNLSDNQHLVQAKSSNVGASQVCAAQAAAQAVSSAAGTAAAQAIASAYGGSTCSGQSGASATAVSSASSSSSGK